jgi:PAS domain S-box-containing protein
MHPLWQQMLDRLPIGISILDAQTQQTLWINAAMQTQLEAAIGRSSVLGQMPAEYLPELDKNQWDKVLRALPSQPQAASLPQRLQFVHHATRNVTYWEWTVQATDAVLPPSYLMLTVQSISDVVMNERLLAGEARKADRARRHAEALMRLAQRTSASLTTQETLRAVTQEAAAFFDSPHAAVLLLQPDGQHFEVGYSLGLQPMPPEQALTLDRQHAPGGQALEQHQTLVLTNIAAQNLQTHLLAQGSPPAALITSPILHNERVYGTVEVYFTVPRDVPADARALLQAFADQTAIALHKADLYDQIAEQRRQLQSIFDNAPVGIVYFDTNLQAAAVNAAASLLFGQPLEALQGHIYSDFLPDLLPSLMEKVRAGEPFHASHSILHSGQPGREEILCDMSLLPVRDESGRVVGILFLCFDITELVRARQEADAARSTAEAALDQARAAQSQMVQMEKMRAIGELASGVAHDFNNALMAILGYTELAEESLDDPKALASHLAIIRKATQDASSTVQRLQRFARQRTPAQGDPTDINVVVQDVVEITRPRWKDAAQREGRTYHIRVDLQMVPLISAEASGLREVLINLVINALNAMPTGGTLSLKTCSYDSGHVEIEVADTGIGMTPEVIARIFDPFFTTRGVEGTGLGLAVSWAIIQRHGGTIEVESAPDQGSRFFVRLPLSIEEPLAPVSPSSAAKPIVAKARLLVVDDEPFVASVLMSILTRYGHQVTLAHSAVIALKLLQEKPQEYDIVLTDHGMPGMTGLQLVEAIKRTWPDLPVLLLTGWGENLLQTHVTDALPDAVLGKPINQTDLLNAVAMALRWKTEKDSEDGAQAGTCAEDDDSTRSRAD